MVARMRIRVDLPAPLGPSKPKTPGPSSRVKSRKPQFLFLNCLPTFWMLNIMGGVGTAVIEGVGLRLVVV